MSQIVDEKNPIPNKEWTLEQWFRACGVKTDTQVSFEAASLGINNDSPSWDPKRVNETKNRVDGIHRREVALDYIKILQSIASKQGIRVFSPERFEDDSRIFLTSKACREDYAPLTNAELAEVFRMASAAVDAWTENLSSLRRRVQPAPPMRLFGRENDMKSVREKIEKYPVSIIDGIAGDGKTSLAWVAASKLYEERRFIGFDWVTDKRAIVDAYGNELPIQVREDEDTFFERLLISMCRQFRWLDIIGALGDRLIDQCAVRLRQGRYLIVVDNIESVKNSESIVRQLLDILSPQYSGEPLSSRALITSRKQVLTPDVGTISIVGIDVDERIPYIRHLEEAWNVPKTQLLRYEQCQALAEATNGNPLFIQVAMRRYALHPSLTTWEWIMNDIMGQHKAFDTLFGSLISQLNHKKYRIAFARCIAAELSVGVHYLEFTDLWDLWQELWEKDNDKPHESFLETLQDLVTNRIISWYGQQCSMHALIRNFLIRS